MKINKCNKIPLAETNPNIEYIVNLSCDTFQYYDIDNLDCMFQQVLAIHLGWADQVQPDIVEDVENIYQLERI